MDAWKNQRRPFFVGTIIPDLSEVVLDYAYELQGSILCTINEPFGGYYPWRAVQLPGNKIATASYGNVIHVLDLRTGQEHLKLQGHTAEVKAMAVRGDRLVSASIDGTARMWNLTTGLCESTLCQQFPLVAVTVLREFVVVGGMYGQLVVWDGGLGAGIFVQDPSSGYLRTVDQEPKHVPGPAHGLLALTTIGDRTLLVQTARQTTLYTVANGVLFLAYNTKDRAGPFSVANDLCVMRGEERIHVWNAGAVSMIPYPLRLLSVCVLRDGRFAASDESQTVRLYKGFNGSPRYHSAYEVIDASPRDVLLLVQLEDGRLAGVDDHCVRVWDTETRTCVWSVPHEGHVTDLKVIHSRLAVVALSLTIME